MLLIWWTEGIHCLKVLLWFVSADWNGQQYPFICNRTVTEFSLQLSFRNNWSFTYFSVSFCSFDESQTRCSLCHIPYSLSNMPFQIQLSKCATCRYGPWTCSLHYHSCRDTEAARPDPAFTLVKIFHRSGCHTSQDITWSWTHSW